MSLNKVMLIGNVGKEPDVRYLDGGAQGAQGRKVATFTLATTERYRDRSGEMRENTEWHNIVAWGQPADVVERFVHRGTQLYIEGKLRTRSWTDQSGAKRYTTEINADSLQLLGRRGDGNPQDDQGQGPYSQGYRQNNSWQAPAAQHHAPAQQYQAPVQQSGPMPAEPAAQTAEPEDDLPF